jgi:hypothetical protein
MTHKSFPDFVIIGAMKSGTTAVANILAEHPQIAFSVPKEPSILMRHDYEAANPGHYVPPHDEMDSFYESCYAGAPPEALWGEGSTAYLADPDSPAIVTRRNPQVKVIVLLRDPATRTRSAYFYSRSVFQEPAATMEEAFRDELSGGRDAFWPNLRHLYYSDYPQHLRRWQQHLQPGHMLLLEFEKYVRDPELGIATICNFLGIGVPAQLPAKKYSNATVVLDTPLKTAAMRFLYTPSGLKALLKRVLPGRLRYRLKISVQDRLAKSSGGIEAVNTYCNAVMEARFAGMKEVLADEFNFYPEHWSSATRDGQ